MRKIPWIGLAALTLFAGLAANAALVPAPNPSIMTDSAQNAFAVVPADADTYARPVRLWIGGAGTIAVFPASSPTTAVTFTVAANTFLPLYVVGVKSTGTTATLIVALY